MKINRLDAHDRYEYFTNQSFDIAQSCQSLIDSRPFGDNHFYIFAHKREIGLDERYALYADDLRDSLLKGVKRKFDNMSQVPNARIIWQPRLTKPKAQTNSMLFKWIGGDNIKIIWILPPEELWEQYEKGTLTQNKTIKESIHKFKTKKEELELPEPEDLSDEKINSIYSDISFDANAPKFYKI